MEYNQARKLIRQAHAELVTHCNPARARTLIEKAHERAQAPELDAAIDTLRNLDTSNLNTVRRARSRIEIAHDAVAALAVAAEQIDALALDELTPLGFTRI